ncbi:MAG: lamin tail domain-containing protein [Bacteroidales bacterium]|nr:lamin tail domain-containing protein [Bacteroidales bacterium]MCF8406181.1 lamin tail domain-containing protein [Bacteroidales bacterium]
MKIKYLFQLLLLAGWVIVCNNLMAQHDTLRVMYYNLLNFPENGDPDREDDFRIVNRYVQPDIILANEVIGDVGAQALLNNSLNVFGTNHYNKAAFIDGPDTDNMLFYNSNKLALYSQSYIPTGLRNISEYVLYYKSPNLASGGDTVFFYFYSAHLKSTEAASDIRLEEVNEYISWINNLNFTENIFFGGDLNLYTYLEPAYQALISQGIQPLNDPLPAGVWHDDYALRQYHTQSTRTSNIGGGATGGLDDRFDFILFSDDVLTGVNKVKYLNNSCLAVGNDANHFNAALIDLPANTSVPDSVNSALYYMSDHLPVICDLLIERPQGNSNSNLVITEIMYNPPEAGLDSLEFIEVYNLGSNPDTLTDYYFTGINFVFPELVLAPGEFIVTAVNSNAMLSTFGISAYEWTSGALLNGSEIIILYDKFGNMLDSVQYDDNLPWPAEADGNGPSITLCDPNADNALGENWSVSTNFVVNNGEGNAIYASPGFSECALPPSADFVGVPQQILQGQSVQFSDLSTNGPDTWNWTFPGGDPPNSSAQNPIVSYNSPGLFSVELIVSNSSGNSTLTKENYIEVMADEPLLIITEIMQNPAEVSDTYGEWFEVFNPTANDIDLLNWTISDNGLDLHTISNSVIVPANGFVVLGRNNDLVLNGSYLCNYQYANFFLSNTDDEIILKNPTGTEIDRVEYDGGPVWPDPVGKSMVFTGIASNDNNNGALWVESSLREPEYIGSSGDFGSPATNGIEQNIQQTGFELNIRVFLEGPFNGSGMNENLGELIPLINPYYNSPWNYNGTENVPFLPTTGIVDWILIELRDATSVFGAIPATTLSRQAAFIRNDGYIVGLDGSSRLYFEGSVTNNLFVVINHRNHLSIISNFALTDSDGIYTYDFSTGSNQAYLFGQKELAPGIWGMISGDTNASGLIDINDKSPEWDGNAGIRAYLPSDINLDSEVENRDKNDYWWPNLGTGTNVPD